MSRRPSLPVAPPLEGNDQLITAVITAGWVITLIVLLIVRDQLAPADRWWTWVAVAGTAHRGFRPGLRALAEALATPGSGQAGKSRARRGLATWPGRGQDAPGSSDSKTVSVIDTPAVSTRS